MNRALSGFTLVELIVAAAASLVLSGIAISGLVTFQNMNQQLEAKLDQDTELNRALRYIANDIKSGKSVVPDSTVVGGRRGLFRINRSDNSTITYYMVRKTSLTPWSGPRFIYRRDSKEARGYTLVDQIADLPPSACPPPPSPLGADDAEITLEDLGFTIRINKTSKVLLCFRGDVPGSNRDIEANIQAITRTQ